MVKQVLVFAINLRNASHRWVFIRRQCEGIGLAPLRIAAFTGAETLPKDIVWTVDELLCKGWCRPEIGCLLSHMAAWRSFLATANEFALILEDDVIFGRDARKVIDTVAFDSNPHLIKLETWFHSTFINRNPDYFISHNTAIHRLRSLHKGSAAYLINRPAAELLLGLLSRVPSRADNLPFNPDLLGDAMRVDQVVPAIAIQQMFLSSENRNNSMQSAIAPVREAHLAGHNIRPPFWERAIKRARRTMNEALKAARYRRLVVPFLAADDTIMTQPEM